MIALARIVVVNWYLWEAMEFEIRGNLAVVGPNASGKSALLDAVQTAYFGGNKRLMEYNASASDKKRSKRSLRGYCLGQVRDLCYPPERTSATTHVCIVFRDGATGHETSAGISLTADVSDADEVIHGRFVVPGTGLTLADFTDRADGLVIPRTWKAVKKSLEGRCKIQECNAEAHFKALIFETKGSHRPDEAKVIRTFRNAVTFDPINDPTEFVRTYILDSAAIAVTRVRENIRHYEQIRQQIGGIKERGASLRKVDASARRIAAALAKAAALEWAGAQLAVEGCDAEAEAAQGILDGLEMQAAAAGEAAADMEQPLAGARSEHLELVAQRNASDVPTRIALEEARQAQAAAEFKVAEDSVSAVGGVLAAAAQLAQRAAGHSAADSMARATAGAAALLAATAGNTGRLAEIAEQADAAVLGISGALDGLAGVAAARDAASREAHDLGARLRDLRAGIREAEAGSSILSPETRHLRDVLASSGIGAEPICNMMEITDERWRDATETLLGSRREMLVVPADRVGDAVRLLRREGIRSAGAHILDPRQTARMQRRATSGSLASVIATDDPDVRAIVVSTIGSCRMVERDDELTGAERSVTADLAYASGGSITRLKPPYGGHKIGRGSSAAALPRLKAEETDTAARLRVAERRQADLESLRTGFESLAGGIQRLKGTAADGASRMAAAAASGEECRRRIGLLRQEDDSALVARIAELADGILSTEEKLRALGKARLDLVREEGSARNLVCTLEEKRRAAAGRRDAAGPGDSGERVREQAIGKAGGDLKAASAECLASAAAATDAARARGQETHVALVEHFQRWPQEIPFAKEAPIAEKAAWVAAEADRLEGDVLLGYEADAERALADVQEALLSDFVSKMSEKFGEIRDRLKELNRILERRTFHGMTYRFKKSDNPAYRDLIDFIEAFSSDVNARTGGLFAAAASPGTDTARSRATAKVRELLAGDETDIRRLEDYRLYFNFDIEMVGADGEVRGTMSGKIGVGSGGENQSPFYVAIGASLAAAYQVDQGDGASNGMALALFDEAFSKLDSGNAVNCLNFMRDVGLQTMIAAPDDKRHLFLETMDTVIDVARYNETELWTDITYTTEAGRRLLVDANPFRDGPDAFLAAGAAA